MKEKFNLYGKCPVCGTDWNGGSIPENIREHYSPPYFWSRLIGVEDPLLYDGVSWWKCPDCNTQWDRWTGEKIENKLLSVRK